MVNNLTHPVLLNVTLNGSLIERLIEPSKPWWADINLLFAAILGAIAAGLFQFFIELWRDKKSNKDNQIQAHSNLLGCKHAILRYHNSYFSSEIYAESSLLYARLVAIKRIDFTPIKSLLEQGKKEETNQYADQELESNLEKSYDLREGLRERERTEDLAIQVGDCSERFWRTIGQIKILFPETKVADLVKEIKEAENDLENLENDIYKTFNEIDTETRTESGSINSIEVRDSWVNTKIAKLQTKKDSTFSDVKTKIGNLDSKIDKLLNYLDNYLKRKRRWQF